MIRKFTVSACAQNDRQFVGCWVLLHGLVPVDRIPRLVAGGLLLSAAILKGFQLLAGAAATPSDLQMWFGWILVPLECFVGLWLFSGIAGSWACKTSLTLFSAFACYSLKAILEGRPSCGCFGQAETSPWVVFVVDLVIISLLIAWGWKLQPSASATASNESSMPATYRRAMATPSWFVVIPSVALGLPAGWFVSQLHSRPMSVGGLVVLKPESWLNQEFVLASQIDIGPELLVGEWIVLLYHYDCPKCQEAVARYERDAMLADSRALRIALVEVPPWSPDESPSHGACHLGRLDESHDWFVQTPTHVRLSNGKVRQVADEHFDVAGQEHVTQFVSPAPSFD